MKLKTLGTLSLLLSTVLCASCSEVNQPTNSTEAQSDTVVDTYTITFYLNGEVYTTKNVNVGTTLIDIPSVPVVEGYTVTWDTTDFSNITESTSVHAVLVANTYTINYYLNDELYQTDTYKYGETITPPTVETEEQTIFTGFSNLPSTMTSSDLNVYGYTHTITDSTDLSTLEASSTINITEAGSYYFTGTQTNVDIIVDSSEEVTLYLASVNVTGLTKPFINVTGASKVNVITVGDSSLTSTDDTIDSVIYSAAPINLSGSAELEINSNTVGIMASKTSLTISGGTFNITSTDKSIQAKGKKASMVLSGGTINLTSLDTAIKSKTTLDITNTNLTINASKDGINAEELVTINSGTITITSKCDGIQGDTGVTILGGTFNIKTNTGYTGNSSNTTSSDFIFEEEDTSAFESEEEYYGLYVLVNSSYIELDSDNYSTYSSYTVFYDRASSKGIKSDGEINISNATITIDSLDDGINSDTTVTVNSGNLNIHTACDGIQADENLTIIDGNVSINTEASFYQTSSGKYKKSGNTYYKVASDQASGTMYDLYNSSKGLKSDMLISISGGIITINSSDDSIHSDEYIEITGGSFTLTTLDDGIHADTTLTVGEESGEDDFSLIVTSSYEGLEAGTIYINCGNIDITASDDGINAGGGSDSTTSNDNFNPGGNMWRPRSTTSTSTTTASYALYINGGNTTINTAGDGLDSNGNIYVTGGKTYVFGPTDSSNTAIDFDGTCTITGGKLLAVCRSGMVESPSSHYVSFTLSSNFTAGSTIVIKDSSGNTVIETTALKQANFVMYCDATLSGSYTLYINDSLKGTSNSR